MDDDDPAGSSHRAYGASRGKKLTSVRGAPDNAYSSQLSVMARELPKGSTAAEAAW
jgi:hypothetical protein